MNKMIEKEMIEVRAKVMKYLEKMNEIQTEEEFDIEWYNNFYDPQGIHVSRRDDLCKKFYINSLLYKKYSDLEEELTAGFIQ